MPKIQNKNICKWCGTGTNYKDECQECKEKVKRIRIIKAMLLGCTLEEIELEATRRKE